MDSSNSIEHALSTNPLKTEKLQVRFRDLYIHKDKITSFKNLKDLEVRYFDDSDNIDGLNIIPQELFELKHLEELMITGHPKIIGIPDKIDHLTKLKHLDFHYSMSLIEIPRAIGNLTSLETLNLCGCNLPNIPHEIGNLEQLWSLELQCNQLTTIPSSVSKLINLEELIIFSNQLSTLPPEISELQNLQIIDISDNPIHQDKIDNLKTLMNKTRISFNDYYQETTKISTGE